ncbi:MAG: Nif3-like dinuclear metal center hexameric protein [Actinomycetota bacterium]|nr:Nif3-like dinuclear metal center hexameric protein [Actinomycetota bacterium]
MASCEDIISFCDELLEASAFADYAPNGLQVPGADEVTSVASGVSANLEFLRAAVGSGAQLVLVHHGLLWGAELRPLSLPMAARLRTLLSADSGLAAYHLPLDAHREVGNNALLRDELGLASDQRPFGEAKGASIGAIGRADPELRIDELEARLLTATGNEPLVFDSGPDEIRTVGIVTGGGAFAIHEAGRLGLDALVTGEPSEPVMAEAREYGIHFLAGGHYATETFGIRRLGELVAERFDLRHAFIDVPNPV